MTVGPSRSAPNSTVLSASRSWPRSASISDGDADAYLLNDLAYRDPADSQLPWWPTPAGGNPATRQAVTAAAAAVGPGARVDELDRERVGTVEWEASVDTSDGREYLVRLDRTGKVLLAHQNP